MSATPTPPVRYPKEHDIAERLVADLMADLCYSDLCYSDKWPLAPLDNPLSAEVGRGFGVMPLNEELALQHRIHVALPEDLKPVWIKLQDHDCDKLAAVERAAFLVGLYVGRRGAR